jgi:uncharacterized protein YaaN involved in tellurite resistance
MPLCGFNKKMIDGIAIFSEGLFEATLQRGEENKHDASRAIKNEVTEIELFINRLKRKYGAAVDTPKKMAEMIYGIAVFAGALFESTLAEANSDKEVKDAFDRKVKAITEFLERVEAKHQDLKKNNSPDETMRKAVEWIDSNDTGIVQDSPKPRAALV